MFRHAFQVRHDRVVGYSRRVRPEAEFGEGRICPHITYEFDHILRGIDQESLALHRLRVYGGWPGLLGIGTIAGIDIRLVGQSRRDKILPITLRIITYPHMRAGHNRKIAYIASMLHQVLLQ